MLISRMLGCSLGQDNERRWVAPSSHAVVVVACGCSTTRERFPSHPQSHKQQKRGFEVLPNQCEIEKATTLNQDLTPSQNGNSNGSAGIYNSSNN